MNIFKLVVGVIIGIVVMSMMFASCERIDAGHVGIKVNMYGDTKGVDDVTEVTGWVFYNPFAAKIVEFPIYMQHKEYTGEESFVVNSKDGSEFHVSPLINYSVQRDKVPHIYSKYRISLDQIQSGFLKTAVYDAFRLTANSYTAEELISNREKFEFKVRAQLDSSLTREGFMISQMTSNLVYPETFKNAIEAKNNAVQQSLTAENQVKTAEAQAKIKIAQAEGEAQSMLTYAKAEAESNRLRQQTLTPLLLQQMWIEKWDGAVSQYSMGNGATPLIMLPK